VSGLEPPDGQEPGSRTVTLRGVAAPRVHVAGMRGALQIGTVGGIPLRLHWTFLLVLPLLATLFAQNYRTAAAAAGVDAARLTWMPWAWGLVMAVGLFASVLAHELAHSLYARSVGLRVRAIVLMLIGGVSEIVDPPRRPRQEAILAAVGPLMSLALGAALMGVGAVLGGRAPPDLVFGLVLLGQLNIVLGVFNLVPAFPMDGGRILRAALTPSLGPIRATRAAATVGKAFAALFAVAGVFTGSVVLVLVGGFVWMGANAEGVQAALRDALEGQLVRDVAGPPVEGVDARASLDEAVRRMREERRLALPVFDGEAVRGVLTLDALRKVPPDRWAFTSTGDITTLAAPLTMTEGAWNALQRMAAEGVPELPVIQDGLYAGVVSQADILGGVRLRALDRSWAAGRGPGPLRRSPV